MIFNEALLPSTSLESVGILGDGEEEEVKAASFSPTKRAE